MNSVLQQSIKKYLMYGSRSNKKLNLLHSYIGKTIIEKLPDDYHCSSLPGREICVQGKFYNKKVDLCIQNGDDIKGIVSVKFIMSNFCQNSNNYFENLVGEMYNLIDSGPRLHIMIIFEDIPYYNKERKIVRYEKIKNLERYDRLVQDGLLSDYIVIKISNGRSLMHPNTVENVLDCSKFNIISEYPQSYDECIESFSKKLKS